ncbi:MAG: isocitrate dehydrogenase [Firmicutes bacterium]|nr:isocitrate dehydrogenase [Bacillota bacterium]
MSQTVIVLKGDQTGQELLEEALRVLDPKVTGIDIQFESFDLSLENRRRTSNQVVWEAARAMMEAGYGLKAATITPEAKNDVGSPNAILREALEAKVIVRSGRRLPGVEPVLDLQFPIAVVRMAVGDAYGADEWREGTGAEEKAYRRECISREVCRYVAEYAFRHAELLGGKVLGGPKYTVSPVYEGMLKEELDAAAERYPHVPYEPQLIDTTYALLCKVHGEPLVIPALNRDGDCLSDLVLPMFGSIAGAESLVLGFNEDLSPKVVMAEAPHGTAPALEGKNQANPLAMILAAAALLKAFPEGEARDVGQAVERAALDCLQEGIRTRDLGGTAGTKEFTSAVIDRLGRA